MKIKQDFKTRGEALLYLHKRGWKNLTTSRGHIFYHPQLAPQMRAIEEQTSGRWVVVVY